MSATTSGGKFFWICPINILSAILILAKHRVSKTTFVFPFIIVAWSCYQGVLCYGKAIFLFPLLRIHSVSCVIFLYSPFCMPFLTWVLHLDLGFPSGHLFNIFLCLPGYVSLHSSVTLFLNNSCPWFNQLSFIEDYSLLSYDAVLIGNLRPTFRRSLLPSSSG